MYHRYHHYYHYFQDDSSSEDDHYYQNDSRSEDDQFYEDNHYYEDDHLCNLDSLEMNSSDPYESRSSESSVTSTTHDESRIIPNNESIFERYDFACGVYKDRYIIIVRGQEGEYQHTQSFVMYDVPNQSYVTLPDLPQVIDEYQGVVVNDYFYVAVWDSLFRMCLLERQEWEVVTTRGIFWNLENMLTDGTSIFLMRGYEGITIFDPSNCKFSRATRNPYASRQRSFNVLIDKKIYIIGGEMISRPTATTFIFDVAKNSWSEGPPLPIPICSDFDAVALNRSILLTGMHGQSNDVRNKNFVYDIHTKKWTQFNTSLSSSPRRNHRCVKVGCQIFTVGGEDEYDRLCPLTTIEIPDRGWIMLKSYLLLRKLVDDKRATSANVTKKRKHADSDSKVDPETKTNANTNRAAVIEKLFTHIPLDVFRYVLMFLK